MKYEKTLAVLAGLTFAGNLAQAQIAIGETLTVSGFADASYVNNDNSTAETSDFNIDEVEIDLAFSLEAVTAEIHLQSTGDNLELEQAFASTNLGGITVSAGRMLNLLGLESDEPTNLVTDSWAYSDTFNPTRRYNEGIRGAFSQGDLSIAASVTDSYAAGIGTAGSNDFNNLAFDVAASYGGIENLSVSLGYATDNGDTVASDLTLVNINATYSLGQISISGEYSDWELGAAEEADSYLIMGTYSVNDDLYLAARYSEVDSNVDGNDEEKLTVAAGYDLTDNLQTRIEYSSGETGAAGTDNDTFAVQGILNF